MPIYEYEAVDPASACARCRSRFEVIQTMSEEPLPSCPECDAPVRRIMSRCRAVVIEESEAGASVQRQISDYESQGMWSHAAELADTHSEKTKDEGMKSRALDNYKKAGYDTDSLTK